MENYSSRHYHLMFPSSMNSWELDIWPPRSYTCSFCNRVFRSAQALGGHMNIHKRERARLKQHSDQNNSSHKSSSLSDPMLENSGRSLSHQKHEERYKYPIVPSMKNDRVWIDERVKRSREITSLLQHHRHHNVTTDLDKHIMPPTKFVNLVDDNVTILSKRHKNERLCSIDHSCIACSQNDGIDLELRLGDSSTLK